MKEKVTKIPTRRARGICAYCGSTKELQDDHIPPRNLFARPRPSNLITVPACKECHTRTSKDDEYFRIKIGLRDDVGTHPNAEANWDAIFRSLKRMKASGLRTRILADIYEVDLKTRSGLYLGKRLAYDVDMNRICQVVERIVRGLYFIETMTPLGMQNKVRIYTDENLKSQPAAVIKHVQHKILAPLSRKNPKTVGGDVFSYRHQIMDENPIISVWFISFYEKIAFLGMTVPHDMTAYESYESEHA